MDGVCNNQPFSAGRSVRSIHNLLFITKAEILEKLPFEIVALVVSMAHHYSFPPILEPDIFIG